MNDAVNHYELASTNDIGTSTCTLDITTQNQPPALIPFFLTGSEDTTFTGMLMATDSSGDTIYFESFAPPATNGIANVESNSGIVDYTPNPDFCGVDTFDWRAFDQTPRYADPTTATVTVICVNDTPVAIDDNLNATG